MSRPYVIAVDFDGTLHDYSKPYPEIGEATRALKAAIMRRAYGSKLRLRD